MDIIKVIPKEVTIGGIKIADVHEIQIKNIIIRKLGESADIYHDIVDGDGDNIGSRKFRLEGDLYQNWGLSDQYIIDLILNFYGLEEKVEEPDEPIEKEPVEEEEPVEDSTNKKDGSTTEEDSTTEEETTEDDTTTSTEEEEGDTTDGTTEDDATDSDSTEDDTTTDDEETTTT